MKVFAPDAVAARRPTSCTRSSGRRTCRPPPDDPGRARRLHGLRRLRRRVPGEEQDRGAPQGDQHGAGAPSTATLERRRWDYFQSIPPLDRELLAPRLGQGLAGARAAVRVLGRVRRLRRDAVPQARHPALRRPHGRGQRHRLLVDLRRQPADDAVDRERRGPRTGVEQLAVRGQRRVRARPAPRRSTRRQDQARALLDPARAARRRGARAARSSTIRRTTETEVAAQRARSSSCAGALSTRSSGGAPSDAAAAARRSPTTLVAPERVDHRRRRLGLRHRLRRPRPRAVGRPQRQHSRARHRGVLEHRRAGVEGDTAGAVAKFAAAGKATGKKDLGAIARAYGDVYVAQIVDGRQRAADDEGAARGGRLAGPVAGDRLQHVHRPRHRHVEVDDATRRTR